MNTKKAAFPFVFTQRTNANGSVAEQMINTGLSMFEYFANSCPAEIPGWFAHKRAPDEPKDIKTADYIIWMGIDYEARYFQWRIYYATKLIEALNKAQQ